MRTITNLLKKTVILSLFLFGLVTQGWSQVLQESFDVTTIPAGWTQSYVLGSTSWQFGVVGGNYSYPSTTHSGAGNARFYYGGYGAKTNLITPAMNLAGFPSATLTFWHAQVTWAGDQDSLTVLYRETSTSTWKRLAIYNTQVSTWTQRTLTLPNLSATYQIAFRGCGYYGYGVVLDDVEVNGSAPPPPPPTYFTVGTGTYTCNYPYSTYWHDGRSQWILSAADIAAAGGFAGLISEIGFDVSSYATQTMNGFNISMQNTTLTNLTAWVTTGWTNVYSGTYAVPGTGWQLITLQNDFAYTGGNLLIEFCFDNTSYTSYSYVRARYGSGYARYYYTDGAAGCSFTSSNTGYYRPNTRMFVTPFVDTLTGTVTNCYNGANLAGVTVTAGSYTATTNAAGKYTFYNIPPGTYTVTYALANFLPKTRTVNVPNNTKTVVDLCLEPIPAYCAGVVFNNDTGEPIVGAKIEAGGATTYSVAGGAYLLSIYPPGTFIVTAEKAGFVDFSAGPYVFTQNVTHALDIGMLRETNPPRNVVATLNTGATAVDINWLAPMGMYEIRYDDGICDNWTVWGTGGNMNAVKFTPLSYPVHITAGKVHIGTEENYPAGANPFIPFEIAIYDDSGPAGMPGQPIGDPITVTPTDYGWLEFFFTPWATISSGNFYLVMIQGGNSPNAAGICIDETDPQLRSYARYVTGGGPWIPASGNFMMRCVVQGEGGPLELGAQAQGDLITTSTAPGAQYNHAPVSVSGYEGQGMFEMFDWSSINPSNTEPPYVAGNTDPNQPTNDTYVGPATNFVAGMAIPLEPTDAVLYNNGPIVTNAGQGPGGSDVSLLENPPLTLLGTGNNQAGAIYVADDFTISGNSWNITSMDFFGYQTNSTTTSTFTGVYVQIWNGQPGTAGATVVWGDRTTNRMSSTSWTNIYRGSTLTNTARPVMKYVASTPGLTLTPGTYWVEFSATGTLTSGPWVPPITIAGTYITGNAIQEYLGVWSPVDGAGGTANPQGVPFIINGIEITPAGDIDYQVWRLKQGEESNPTLWTSIGTTTALTMTDNGWPSLPCGPYRWAVKAIYQGNRISPAAFSNGIGKCWTADVTVNVTLTCDSSDITGAVVTLNNTDYDSTYTATLPGPGSTGSANFPTAFKGNYTVMVSLPGYETFTGTYLIMDDMTIDVYLLQSKLPPRDMDVTDNKTLFCTWRPPTGEILNETFAGGFGPNEWTHVGNWSISSAGGGNPVPAAQCSWTPSASNYSWPLTSKWFTGPGGAEFNLKYDIRLDDFSANGTEHLTVEISDGGPWVALADYSNTGDIAWTTETVDISAYSGSTFQVRFNAHGTYSFYIDYWYIDNVKFEPTMPDPGPCVLAYNVYVNNMLSGVTTDTTYTIPGMHVQYGQFYDVCVKAVYGSGYSGPSCDTLTSSFLWPPLNLQAELLECVVYLTWEKPIVGTRVSVPEFEGTVVNTTPDPGLAPITAVNREHNHSPMNTDGSIVFGCEAVGNTIIDFDVDDLPNYTVISTNTAPNFIAGLVFPVNETDWAYGSVYGYNNLYQFDRATGAMTNLGNIGATFNDLALDPTTNMIYGTTGTNLYSIDPSGPSATLIGPHGGGALYMIGIACDMSGNLYGYNLDYDMFQSIDKTTGAATDIGSIGFNANYAQAMFFDQGTSTVTMAAMNGSNLYAEIRAVDVTTGGSVILSSSYYEEVTGAAMPISGGGGGGDPAGLLGYKVYRDGAFIALVTNKDTTWYYDTTVEPGSHSYEVSAWYDLTDYGYPGNFDESYHEGPVQMNVVCGRDLPFCEYWDENSFGYNDWTFAMGQGNWDISTAVGNPLPSADFGWMPFVTDYSYSLESPTLNAGPWNCASVWLDFDYKLVDRNATGAEMLTVDVLWSGSWHEVLEIANNGSVDWTSEHLDITAAGGKAIKVRFTAHGENSEDILHWYVDNICVYGICNPPLDLTIEQSHEDVYLTWTAPTCTSGGGGTVMEFIFDDGSAENGWRINAGYLAWLGNEFPIDPSFQGVIQQVDMWWGFLAGGAPSLVVDFFNGSQVLVGTSDSFDTPSDDWVSVAVPDVPFSGPFYAMVKWDMTGSANYMGFDEDGPYASQDLEWYYDGSAWDKLTALAGSAPGVFLMRITALVGGDKQEVILVPGAKPIASHTIPAGVLSQSGMSAETGNHRTMGVVSDGTDNADLVGYNVYRAMESDPYELLTATPVADTTYHDVLPGGEPYGIMYHYYVTTVYNDEVTGEFLCESPESNIVDASWPPVGINDLGNGSIHVFPNPATDIVNVKSDYTISNIEVMNFIGQTVYTQSGVDSKTTKINVSSLQQGVYFVKVTTKEGVLTVKITVTH